MTLQLISACILQTDLSIVGKHWATKLLNPLELK